MIIPVRMSKIRIIGPKTFLKKATEIIHSEAVVHIEDFKPSKYNIDKYYFDIGDPFQAASKYSALLIRLRALIAGLKLDRQRFAPAELPKEPEKVLAKLEADYAKLVAKQKDIEEKKKELERIEEPLRFVSALKLDPKDLVPLENVVVFKGYYESEFEGRLAELTKKYMLKTGKLDKEQIFVLFVDKQYAEKVKEILDSCKYKEMQVPAKLEYKSLEELLAERKGLEEKERKIAEQIDDFKGKKGGFVISYEYYLRRENEKAEAPLRFGGTENIFVVEGYVPTNRYEDLHTKVEQNLGKKVHIEKFEGEVEFVPTKLENPSLIGSFEFFLDLYSMPLYKELDPTFLIFITFPFFFGFMLGDIGYGLVTAILFAIIRLTTRSAALKGLLNAMILASIATIGFGFVFGEFFGGQYFGLQPIIHRETEISFMMLFTILVGLVHVNLGLLLGFVNVKRLHGLKYAILEKLSWIVLECGGILILFKLYNFFYTTLPQQLYVGAGIVIVGLLMLVKAHGVLGIVEVPTLVSNILSYTRLFALGMGSVALAVIVNEFTTEFLHRGGIMIIFALAILVAGHVTNIALGVMGGFLQSLRLHYVEFFTKFYKGGGKKYNPFGGS